MTGARQKVEICFTVFTNLLDHLRYPVFRRNNLNIWYWNQHIYLFAVINITNTRCHKYYAHFYLFLVNGHEVISIFWTFGWHINLNTSRDAVLRKTFTTLYPLPYTFPLHQPRQARSVLLIDKFSILWVSSSESLCFQEIPVILRSELRK